MALRIKKTIGIVGMTCSQCEKTIHGALASVDGVSEVTASFRSNSVSVLYDSLVTNESVLHQAIRNAGYDVAASAPAGKRPAGALTPLQLTGFGVLLIAVYLLIDRTVGFNFIPQVNASMGYGMLFVVGLLTSLHCIAMCGGINLSQCIVQNTDGSSRAGWKPSLLYNSGRVISYTIIGGFVGALGSVVSFPGPARGIIAILAGIFMVVMGVNMLGLLPVLRRFQIHMPAGIRNRLMGKTGERGPFIIGLLNGLMPCGPLQAMQLYALGTGSALAGALSMLVFSLGTVPLMFGFGAVSTLLSKKFTRSVLRFSAALVVLLGLIMMQRGFSLGGIQVFGKTSFSQPSAAINNTNSDLSGLPDPSGSMAPSGEAGLAGSSGTSDSSAGGSGSADKGVQMITGEVLANAYPAITVKKGVPVEFNLHVEKGNLTGCNRTVIFPEYNIELDLKVGDNFVTFTPEKSGQIGYTCWMGMISSTITVED